MMSISDKQLAANRRNATLSTGPRTDAGKQAQNEFLREYIADWNPLGAIDLQLARTLAMDNWRLNRIRAVEENIFENALTHAVSYMQYADRINKISLYESRLSRIIAGNMDILSKRQADRKMGLVLRMTDSCAR
jgi:hypothetical protein